MNQGKIETEEIYYYGELSSEYLYKYEGDNLVEKLFISHSGNEGVDTSQVIKYRYQGNYKTEAIYYNKNLLGVFAANTKKTYNRTGSTEVMKSYYNRDFNIGEPVWDLFQQVIVEYSGNKVMSTNKTSYFMGNESSLYTSYSYTYSDTGYVQTRVTDKETITIEYEKAEGNDELFFTEEYL